MKDSQLIKKNALMLLARREHSSLELKTKLLRKGYLPADIDLVLVDLQNAGFQDDKRFGPAWCRSRLQRGVGPVRIRQELNERGLLPDALAQFQEQEPIDWFAKAYEVLTKRFKKPPEDAQAWQKQARFLQSRGFAVDHIRAALKTSTRNLDVETYDEDC